MSRGLGDVYKRQVKVSFTQLDLYTGARSQVQKEIPFTLKASVEADAKAVHVTF